MLIKFSDKFYYTKQRYMYLEPTLGYLKGEYFSVMLDSGNGPVQVENFLNEFLKFLILIVPPNFL